MENTLEKQKWYRLMAVGVMLYIILKMVSGLIEQHLRVMLLHLKVNGYTTFWTVTIVSSIPVIVAAYMISKRVYKRISGDPFKMKRVFVQFILALTFIWLMEIILPFIVSDSYFISYGSLFEKDKPGQVTQLLSFQYFLIISQSVANALETILILLAIGIKK